MSVRLLMPALQPAAVETGLFSVLARLSPQGEVAHEEDIGEFAILDHRKADGSSSDAPVYNYNMVDSDYMLAPVARAWLLDDPRGRARAAAFLARRVDGETLGARMVRNLRFVLRQAQPFARDPVAARLIALKPGMDAGEWRDSNDGLAGGRIPMTSTPCSCPPRWTRRRLWRRAGCSGPISPPAMPRRLAKRGRLPISGGPRRRRCSTSRWPLPRRARPSAAMPA